MDTALIERLTPPASEADLLSLAALLVDAVESGAAVSFVLPLPVSDAASWWRRTLGAWHPRGELLVARDATGIVGSVLLQPAWAPNQPHRAEIVKLIVHRRARGHGLGRRLMTFIEDAARQRGFTLLTLDAKRGATAEMLYRDMGWTCVGAIPAFALDPDGRTPHDAVIYYKHLR